MPTTDDHVAQAQHNLAFIRSLDLDSTPFTDWIVTAYFYSALHLVDAYLGTLNVHPHTHVERNRFVGRRVDLRVIGREYTQLQVHSLNARYETVRYSAAKVRTDVIPLFQAVNAHVVSLLT